MIIGQVVLLPILLRAAALDEGVMLGRDVPLLLCRLQRLDEVGATTGEDLCLRGPRRQVELLIDGVGLAEHLLLRRHLVLVLVEAHQVANHAARIALACVRALHDGLAHRGRRVVGGDLREG